MHMVVIFTAVFPLVIGIFCKPSVAQAVRIEALDRLIENPSEWRLVDWSKPGLLDHSKWLHATERGTRPDRSTIDQVRDAPAFGLPAMKHLRRRSISTGQDTKLELNTEVAAITCNNWATSFGKDLGRPIFSNDTSRIFFSEKGYIDLVRREWQWTVGGTRIGAKCAGPLSTSDVSPQLTLSFTFESIARREILKPAFMLRCTQFFTPLNGRKPIEIGDFLFWVKQGSPGAVRDSRLIEIGDEDTTWVDDQQIVFTLITSATSTRYTVDRVTGRLHGVATGHTRLSGVISGNCKADA